MNRLNDQKSEEKHVKSIALKAAAQKTHQDSSDCSDTETLYTLIRTFGKFLKKNNKEKAQSSNRCNSKKITGFNYANYPCFGCAKQGHIKVEYPNTVRKRKRC